MFIHPKLGIRKIEFKNRCEIVSRKYPVILGYLVKNKFQLCFLCCTIEKAEIYSKSK